MFVSKKEFEKGFTITELLVVIAIIGTMSTVVWVNHSKINRNLALERSVNQIAQETRQVLEKSMSAEVPENIIGEDFKGGYGVFFEEGKNNYIVFVDVKNSGGYQENQDEILKLVEFEFGVKIKEVNLIGNPPCNQDLFKNVVFLSPDPFVFIGGRVGGKSRCDEIEIILMHEHLDEEKKVTINQAGLIEIND